jgi:hypothetical protein
MDRLMQRGYDQQEKAMELAPYEVVIKTIPTELAQEVRGLLVAMNRAACDLEHQGQRSQRIAVQLLTAMAQFTAKTGLQ